MSFWEAIVWLAGIACSVPLLFFVVIVVVVYLVGLLDKIEG